METKITPMEFMKRLREKAEAAKAEGRTVSTIPAQHSKLIKKMRERAEKMRTEGNTVRSMPAHNELFARLRERAMLKKADLKKVETTEKTEIEKKEE